MNIENIQEKTRQDRNLECQAKFFNLTENKSELVNCFLNGNELGKQCDEWFRNLFRYFHQSFVKTRSCQNKKKLDEVDILLNKRKELIQKVKKANDDEKEELNTELEETEASISKLTAIDNRNKVIENFEALSGIDGSTNQIGVWALKRKIFPKNRESLPFAKRNFEGKFVTTQKELKSLYVKTFTNRLRHRPIKTSFEHINVMKEELCTNRMKLASLNKSEPWNKDDLMKVLSSLKAGKARDPHGLLNELFKPGVAGTDFQTSFLIMGNKIKKEIFIPKFMEFANIISIHMGNGS